MITKLIGETTPITYRAVNTDFAESPPGNLVIIEQKPEESGDRIWVLDAIQYSYKKIGGAETLAAPITGGITIKLDDKVKWDADISDYTGVLNLYIPSQTDKTLSVTLKSGGNGVVGKLNCQWHLEPAQ